MTLALVGGKLIDGTGREPQEDSTVVIDDGKIVEISEKKTFGAGVETVDISGKIVMPGLIDTHVHVGPWFQWLASSQGKALTGS